MLIFFSDDSLDVEGSDSGDNVAVQPLSEREVTPSQPGAIRPAPKVTSALASRVSFSTQNNQAEANSPYTDSTHSQTSLPSINVASVSGSSERHAENVQKINNAEHDRAKTGFSFTVCNENRQNDSCNIKDKAAVKSNSKLPVAANTSNLSGRDNGLVRGSSVESLSFSEVKNKKITDNSQETCVRPSNRVMYANSSIETRRRNFSSSSLPLSLMTATIEEVDDADYVATPPSSDMHQPQRHSYSESSNPPSKIPFRTLRRESRVPSMNSPPRIRRSGHFVGLTRSASDNTYRVAHLRDVDIVGESFTSRFPWQKDVAVQCRLPSGLSVQGNLQRAMSGPAEYSDFPSMTSNNSAKSPPTPSTRGTLHNYGRSYSHSDLNQFPAPGTSDRTSGHTCHRRSDPQYKRANSATSSIAGSSCQYSAPVGNYQRTAFQRRSRSSLIGTVDTSRYCYYHHYHHHQQQHHHHHRH